MTSSLRRAVAALGLSAAFGPPTAAFGPKAALGVLTPVLVLLAAGSLAGQVPAGESQASMVLMIWGGVRADGEVVLEPAFAYEGRVRNPGGSGDYRVRGLDGEGETLFSIRFTPGGISDGSKGFSYSIPFDPAWTEALDRLELSGPEGVATVGREAGARAVMAIDRASGQVRSILRNAAAGLPPELAADSVRLRILRGLPRPRPPGRNQDERFTALGAEAGVTPRTAGQVYCVGTGVSLGRAGGTAPCGPPPRRPAG